MQNRTPVAPEARSPLPDFTPAPRKYRHDGWTPERQRALIAAQVADPGVGLVRIGERSAPYCGPLQLDDDPGEIVETGRPAGEAHWVSAGDAIPDAYREWIEAAEARGEPTAAVPLDPTGADGVARVRPRPPRRRRAADPPSPG